MGGGIRSDDGVQIATIVTPPVLKGVCCNQISANDEYELNISMKMFCHSFMTISCYPLSSQRCTRHLYQGTADKI